jgi:hydrogenase-4 component E
MEVWSDIAAILLILANLRLLGSSRLSACIQTVAMQALLLGALTLLMHGHGLDARVIVIAALTIVLKAGVLPWLLRRAAREAGARREVEPLAGFTTSMLIGAGLLGASFWIGRRLRAPTVAGAELIVPVALFTLATGLLVIVSRKKAINQVLGYLAMENGIYAFGMTLAIQTPLLVELGVLLDVLVAVFVMGIIIYHISREFDHIDTDRLSVLKD